MGSGEANVPARSHGYATPPRRAAERFGWRVLTQLVDQPLAFWCAHLVAPCLDVELARRIAVRRTVLLSIANPNAIDPEMGAEAPRMSPHTAHRDFVRIF
jgi:hypothetical protein